MDFSNMKSAVGSFSKLNPPIEYPRKAELGDAIYDAFRFVIGRSQYRYEVIAQAMLHEVSLLIALLDDNSVNPWESVVLEGVAKVLATNDPQYLGLIFAGLDSAFRGINFSDEVKTDEC